MVSPRIERIFVLDACALAKKLGTLVAVAMFYAGGNPERAIELLDKLIREANLVPEGSDEPNMAELAKQAIREAMSTMDRYSGGG